MNKKQVNKNKATNSKLWQSISDKQQIDIKGGKSSLNSPDLLCQASVWPPKYPPFN